MATRTRRRAALPWPTYRIAWRRPKRRGSDDWQRVMVVDPRPEWTELRPDDGARPPDPLTPLWLMLASAFVLFLAVYGAIALIGEVVGW